MSELAKTAINSSRMGPQLADGTRIEPIHPYYGYTGIILSMFFFQIVYKVVCGFGAPKALSTDEELWKWRNLVVSCIHAVIITLWDIACIALYPEMWEDLINHVNWPTFGMVAFSTGYFFFDFVDIFMTGRVLRQWEICIHHVCVAGMFFYNLVSGRCICYNAIALWAEYNSIFLHLRKLLQMAKVDFSHWAYRCNVYANLSTFLIFRFGALGAIVYGILNWASMVPAAYYWSICASMFCMIPINVILFWRLFKNDILRYHFSSKNQKKRNKESIPNNCSISNNNMKENNHFVQSNHIKAD